MQTLSFFPGQLATFLLEIKNTDGYRADSLTDPAVTRIFGFTTADGYSTLDGYFSATDGYQNPLIKIDTGLYYVKITLPKLASSLGCYLVDVSYTDPDTGFPATRTYQLLINAPFGNFGVVRTI